MKRFIVGIFLIACATVIVGCETMKGAGKDIQSGGREIQEKAS